MSRHVLNQPFGKVTLNTANQVVVRSVNGQTDNAESVIFLDGRSGDAGEETLLHATFEAEDGDLG